MEVLLRFDTTTNDPAVIDPSIHGASLKTLALSETVAAPFVVNSTALVNNLNVQFLDGAQLNDIGGPSNAVMWSSQQIYDFVIDIVNQIDWQQSVLSSTTITPPPTPANRDRYIIPAGATGAWAGKTNQVAQYNANIPAWSYTMPNKGYASYVEDQDRIYLYNGAAWVNLPGVGNHEALGGLLGGDVPSGHWHLTATEHLNTLKALLSVGTTKVDHSLLENLQGGSVPLVEYYHLTSTQHNSLTGGLDASSLHNHGSLYYTKSQVDSSLSGKANTVHTHRFIDLTDTPIGYGFPGESVVVNPAGDGLIFTAMSDINVLADYTDASPGRLVDKVDGVTLRIDGTLHVMEVIPGVFAPASHDHNTLYYTKTELNTSGGGGSVHWDNVDNKPSTFPPDAHNHDDIYYQESEIDSFLSGKSDTTHTHDFIDLNDVPSNYVGQSGKSVVVKVDESGLEFGTVSGTDELVKMHSGDTAGYLASKVDADTIKYDIGNHLYVDLALDGLNDVDAASPNPYDVLRFDVGSGNWVASNIGDLQLSVGFNKIIYVDVNSSHVGENGSIAMPYKSLAFAASIASAGEIIYLGPGVYDETMSGIVIPSNVSLQGSGLHRTHIMGNISFSGGTGVFRDINHSGGTITSNATLSVYAVYSTGNVVIAAGDLTSNDFTIRSVSGVPLYVGNTDPNAVVSFMNSSVHAPDGQKAIQQSNATLNLSSVDVRGNVSIDPLIHVSGGRLMVTSGTSINVGGGSSILLDNSAPIPHILVDVMLYGDVINNSSVIVDNLHFLVGVLNGLGVLFRQGSDDFDNDTTIAGTTISDALDTLKSDLDDKTETVSFTDGNFAEFDVSGNLQDSGVNISILNDIESDLFSVYEKDSGETITLGQVVAINDSNKATKARAGSESDYFRVLGIVESIDGDELTVRKFGKLSGLSFTGSNKNIYLSASTAGSMTETAPSGSGQIVLKLGFSVSSTEMEFRISDYAIVGS